MIIVYVQFLNSNVDKLLLLLVIPITVSLQ